MAIIICQACGFPIEDAEFQQAQKSEITDHEEWEVNLVYSYYHSSCCKGVKTKTVACMVQKEGEKLNDLLNWYCHIDCLNYTLNRLVPLCCFQRRLGYRPIRLKCCGAIRYRSSRYGGIAIAINRYSSTGYICYLLHTRNPCNSNIHANLKISGRIDR